MRGHRSDIIWGARALTILLVVVICSLAASREAAAAAIVTPAGTSGVTTLSADTAADATSPAWTTLTGPSLAEFDAGDVGNGTLIFSAPSGFAFNTSGASVATSSIGACPLTVSVTAQSASSITTTISGGPSTNGNQCTLTWSGIQARPASKSPLASGDIVSSGTATIAGVSSSTSFGTLQEVAGDAAKLALSAPSGCKGGVACTTQPVAIVQDAWGNAASSSAAITLALTTNPTGATLSVTTNPLNATNGQAQFAGMSVDKQGSGYVITATSSGLTSATATFDASYGNCAGAVTQKCITSFKVDLTGSGTFATVTDANTTLDVVEQASSIQVQVKYAATGSDGYDLLYTGSPYGADTVFEIGVNVGSFNVIETVLTGDMTSYTSTVDAVGGNTVTLRSKPKASSWLTTGCTVFSCGGLTTAADRDYGGLLIGALSDLSYSGPEPPGSSFATYRSSSRGAWVATNAQSFTDPNLDPATGAFSFVVAAPHLKLGGGVNSGFFNAFVPDALLTNYWGVADPASLPTGAFTTTQTVSGVGTTVGATPTRVAGGFLISSPSFDYSTPGFSVAPKPTVTSLSEDTGPPIGGTPLFIAGSRLTAASSVTFGGTAATFTVVSPTLIRTTSPAHGAGSVDVVVTTAGGTSESGRSFHYVLREPPEEPPVTQLPRGPVGQPVSSPQAVQLPSDGRVTVPVTISTGAASLGIPAGTTVRRPDGTAYAGRIEAPTAVTKSGVVSAYDFSPGASLRFDRPVTLTLPVPSGGRGADYQPVAVDASGALTYLLGTAGSATVSFTTDHLSVYALASVPKPAVRAVSRSVQMQTGHHAAWAGQSDYVDLAPGQLVDLAVRYENTGTLGWYRGIAGWQANLGTNAPPDNRRDYDAGVMISPLFGKDRYATTETAAVNPGEVGSFSMRVRAPTTRGPYQIRVRPVIEGTVWLEDEGVFLQITVR